MSVFAAVPALSACSSGMCAACVLLQATLAKPELALTQSGVGFVAEALRLAGWAVPASLRCRLVCGADNTAFIRE